MNKTKKIVRAFNKDCLLALQDYFGLDSLSVITDEFRDHWLTMPDDNFLALSWEEKSDDLISRAEGFVAGWNARQEKIDP
jgi:hypothetical protein